VLLPWWLPVVQLVVHLVKVAADFNDSEVNSGGVVNDHELFRDIDPEVINDSGTMTNKQVYNHMKQVIKEYAFIMKKYTASGQNEESNFPNFCHDFLCDNFRMTYTVEDLTYFFYSLKKSGTEELRRFCREGNELENGFDSASTDQRGTSTNTDTSNGSGEGKSMISVLSKLAENLNDKTNDTRKALSAELATINVHMSSLETRMMVLENQEDSGVELSERNKKRLRD